LKRWEVLVDWLGVGPIAVRPFATEELQVLESRAFIGGASRINEFEIANQALSESAIFDREDILNAGISHTGSIEDELAKPQVWLALPNLAEYRQHFVDSRRISHSSGRLTWL